MLAFRAMALPVLIVHHARNGVHAFNVLTATLRAESPSGIFFTSRAARMGF